MPDRSMWLGKLARDNQSVLFALIFVSVFVALFSDFFLTNRLFYARDMAGLEIPLRKHVVSLMKEGHLPLWTEAYGNGQPVLANPKNAVFYPSTWLYLILPFSIAFKFHFLFHAIMAWLGLYMLGLSFRLSKEASFLGATSYLLGGFYLSSIEFYNHIAAFCWLPWLLLSFRSRTPRAPRTLLTLIVLWSLILLAGAPHFIPLSALFVFLAVVIAGDKKRERLCVAFLTFSIAIFLSAIQLFPAFELLKGKSRDPGETLRWSLEPVQLVNLVVPGLLGADRGTTTSEYWGGHMFDKGYPLYYSLYASPGLLLLALLGLKKPRDRIKVLFMVSALVFFFLSMLRLFPFFTVLSKVPGIGTIRYPVNYLSGSLLSISFLAALGFETLRTQRKPFKIFLSLAFSLGLAAVVAFLLWHDKLLAPLLRLFVITNASFASELKNSIGYSLLAFTIFSAILLIVQISTRSKLALLWIFTGLLVLDLSISNRGINPTIAPSSYNAPAFLSDKNLPLRVYRDPSLPDDLSDTVGHDRRLLSYLRASLNPYTSIGSVHYIYDHDFFSLYSPDLAAVVQKLKRASAGSRKKILADARCDYSISPRSLLESGLPPAMIEGQPIYFEPVPDRHDKPYFAATLVKVNSTEQALSLFDQDGFDPASSVIVYEDLGFGRGPFRDAESQITVREEGAGRLACSFVTPQAGLAVLPIRYDPGWIAHIDGCRVRILRSNLISIGIRVPPGAHEATFLYSPKSLKYGRVVSLLTLLGLGIFTIVHHKRRDKKTDQYRDPL